MNDIEIQSPRGTQSKPVRVLATIASYILHPVFLPIIMSWVILTISPASFAQYDKKGLTMLFLQIAITTIAFPVLVVVLLKALGFVNSILLRNQKERIIPLLATMMCYWWVSHVFKNIEAPVNMQILMRGAYWSIIVLFVCSIFFKISMHTVAAGGVVGLIIVLMIISPVSMVVPLFTALFFAGVVGTARMILNAHYPLEIWLGYIVGIAAQVGAYYYLVR